MSAQETEMDSSSAVETSPSAKVKPFSNRWMAKVYEEKPPFPEEILNTVFAAERITTIVKALKEATAKEVQESNRLLDDDFTYSLQITSFKIPHVNVHLSRILLTHSLLNDDSEICLFVKDLKRGRRVDFEPTIQHYEKILRANKIKHSITVIPLNQLFNEYASFELRRKLTFAYDKFLADGAIAAHVNGFLGTKMLNKGRIAFPVNLGAKDLAEEIDTALRKVCYKHLNRGVTQNIQVGKHSMTDEQVAENVIDLVKKIGEIHPGGYENVHKLHLKPQHNLSVSIPIYVSLDRPKEGVPADSVNKDILLQQQSAKASEILEKFDITAAAKLIQRRRLPFVHSTIVDEDHLLSDDETTSNENVPRLRRGNFGDGGPIKRARPAQIERAASAATATTSAAATATATTANAASAAKPAAARPSGNASQQNLRNKAAPAGRANTAQRVNASPRVNNQSPRGAVQGRVARRNVGNRPSSANIPNNNTGNTTNRSGRNPNGIASSSRAAIGRSKRQNLNVLSARTMKNVIDSNDPIRGAEFLRQMLGPDGLGLNNDNRRTLKFQDNDYLPNDDFYRDNNYGRNNSSFSSMNLGSSYSGGGNSFGGRGFNNGNRF